MTTDCSTRSRSSVAVISRLISSSRARSWARRSTVWSLGVAQSARGGGGEPLEQLAVVLVERTGAACAC